MAVGVYSLLRELDADRFSARGEKMFKRRYGAVSRHGLLVGLGSVARRIGAHGHGKRASPMVVPA